MIKLISLQMMLMLLVATATQAETQEVIRSSTIPSFSVSELQHRHAELTQILQTTGLLSISLSPTTSRHVALQGLCDCSGDLLSLDGTDTAVLDDDATVRTTLATATVGTTPLALPAKLEETCGADAALAMETLRDAVAVASHAFVQAVDRTVGGRSSTLMRDVHGKKYPTVQSLLATANHLEHFHVYKKNDARNKEEASLDWHTDAGLFLAFVPAVMCGSTTENDTAFYYKDAQGLTTRAIFDNDSIVFMLGAGAQHWLQSSGNLKATQHAVQMKAGTERAWYGMMHLVPESAIIQTSPDRTFGDMKKNMVLKGPQHRQYGHDDTPEVVSIGCGPSVVVDSDDLVLETTSRRRMQHVDDATACNNATNFFCWMRCLDIPQHEQAPSYVNEGYSLYCLDPGILASSGNKVSTAAEPCEVGWVHNSNCMGVWQPTAPGVPSQEVTFDAIPTEENPPFCYGGTSMYMDGFTWIHDTTCVIYLFPKWVLTTQGKFAAAAIGTFIFGILLEYTISQRRQVVSKLGPGYQRLAASALFYGLQLTMGYLLMLVVMIYSGPLFLCTILGIVGGHVLFNAKDAVFSAGKKSNKTLHTAGVEECCSGKEGDVESSTTGDNEPPCCDNKSEDDNEGVPEGSTPCCQHTL